MLSPFRYALCIAVLSSVVIPVRDGVPQQRPVNDERAKPEELDAPSSVSTATPGVSTRLGPRLNRHLALKTLSGRIGEINTTVALIAVAFTSEADRRRSTGAKTWAAQGRPLNGY